MPLPRPSRPFLFLALALLPPVGTLAADGSASADAERTALAHLLAFGRPAAGVTTSPDPLVVQLERHHADLQRSATAREQTARAAWRDAFGREPSPAESQAEAVLPLPYTERLPRHLAHLRATPDEYRAVIQRAYRLVVHRDAYAEEFDYWQPHGVLPFVVLVACIEDWARRNRPGLMVTAGQPTVPARSRFVTIVPLSPALAAEARAARAKSPSSNEASRVLAAGAERIATPSGMHVAIVGRDD